MSDFAMGFGLYLFTFVGLCFFIHKKMKINLLAYKKRKLKGTVFTHYVKSSFCFFDHPPY